MKKKQATKKGAKKSASAKKTAKAAVKAPVKKKAAKEESDETKLKKLFENELKDIYWAEKALTKALPKMAKNATSEDLTEAIENHLEETEGQIEKLEQVFELLEMKPQAKKCEAMAGLIKEAEEIMKECDKGAMRDAGIISAGQKVEHYEIATYGTLRTFARTLGLDDAAELLEEILEEEKAADEKLTEVAEAAINIKAAEEEEDEEEEDEEETEDEEVENEVENQEEVESDEE
ncbi:MAG: ferritin-like domain-containing protein [Bacteroidia bacterium]